MPHLHMNSDATPMEGTHTPYGRLEVGHAEGVLHVHARGLQALGENRLGLGLELLGHVLVGGGQHLAGLLIAGGLHHVCGLHRLHVGRQRLLLILAFAGGSGARVFAAETGELLVGGEHHLMPKRGDGLLVVGDCLAVPE